MPARVLPGYGPTELSDYELTELAAKAAGVHPRELDSATRTTSGFDPLNYNGMRCG